MYNDKTTLRELLLDMESKGLNVVKVNRYPNGELVRGLKESA